MWTLRDKKLNVTMGEGRGGSATRNLSAKLENKTNKGRSKKKREIGGGRPGNWAPPPNKRGSLESCYSRKKALLLMSEIAGVDLSAKRGYLYSDCGREKASPY